MKIETKLNAGSECYFLKDNFIQKGRIRKLLICVTSEFRSADSTKITYEIQKEKEISMLEEDEVFKTIEETLNYLERHIL